MEKNNQKIAHTTWWIFSIIGIIIGLIVLVILVSPVRELLRRVPRILDLIRLVIPKLKMAGQATLPSQSRAMTWLLKSCMKIPVDS